MSAARLMPVDWRIEPIRSDHIRTEFACGEPDLDRYLTSFARQNDKSGVARTFVAVADPDPARVLGYYSLAVGAIDKADLPPSAGRRFPNHPVPVARLARIARDLSQKKSGLGEYLLVDSMLRCLRVAEEVGIVAVVVDAKNEGVKDFYLRYEFTALPDRPLTLWLPMPALRKLADSRPLRPQKVTKYLD